MSAIATPRFYPHRRTYPALVLMLCGIGLLYGYFINSTPPPSPPPVAESVALFPAPEPTPEPPAVLYPTDKLFIADTRKDYESGSMQLTIPRLGLDVPVLGDTGDETLNNGVGLYEYAQLPDRGNPNVSIAAHRDIHGMEFYYIDTLTEGDLFYLTYDGKRYTYRYQDTVIVQANDWGPIYSKEFSALTLTSCDPIGTSRNRIIVTAKLIDIETLPTDEAAS